MFGWEDYGPKAPEETLWDVVIIGAGMGGSTVGLSLARRGLSVLFLERGRPATSFTWPRGGKLKRFFRPELREADLAARGRWPRAMTIERRGRKASFYMPIGNGPGGSSAIYGAALERLRRVDFAETVHEGGDSKPLRDDWPLDYDAFAAYYRRAEELYGVRGTPDPADPDDTSTLGAPPPLGERDRHFFESFETSGLAPYRLHVGIEYKPGCTECLGLPCPRDCKAEGSSRALKPALSEHGAKILFDCEVERVELAGGHVKRVIARVGARNVSLRGQIVILAAGALCTPNILLNSDCDEWPGGIGNANGLVGRCLMFHVSDLVALWPAERVAPAGPSKTLSSRAFYVAGGRKLGGFQSLGLPVSSGQVYEFLRGWYDRNISLKVPLLGPVLMVVAMLATRFFRNAVVFATIMEDFPYRENRVHPDAAAPSGFSIAYEPAPELASRTALMRGLLSGRLARHRPFFLTGADNLNFGHPSGTCRFGADPMTSVLTPDNQVRGVPNLYVVDASFFPSSGGGNPSLTIAANALRVADRIVERLAKTQIDAGAGVILTPVAD
jgi:choline dehydrogenase-like flavoprotein